MQHQTNWALGDAFRKQIPLELEPLFLGRRHWNRREQHRESLAQPRDEAVLGYHLQNWDDGTRAAAPRL